MAVRPKSEWTETKDIVVPGIAKWLLTAIKNKVTERNPAIIIDANASTGEGSPAQLYRIAVYLGIPFRALFIERDRDAHRQLLARPFANDQRVTIERGDNSASVLNFCEQIGSQPHGLIYHDPCGEPDFDMLSNVSRMPSMRMIDILSTCPATAIKRRRGAFHTGLFLEDQIGNITKRHKLVRKPFQKWQWTILLFTNWDGIRAWPSQRLVHYDSEEGQAYLEEMNYSERERGGHSGQSTLPFI